MLGLFPNVRLHFGVDFPDRICKVVNTKNSNRPKPTVADGLRVVLAIKTGSARAFKISLVSDGSTTLKRDLKVARRVWIKAAKDDPGYVSGAAKMFSRAFF